jgi:hypothetical protein
MLAKAAVQAPRLCARLQRAHAEGGARLRKHASALLLSQL